MAKRASIALILTIACLLVSTLDTSKQGRIAELEFYVHLLFLDHPSPTSYEVARASITNTSATSFGRVTVQDRMVTVGPDPRSEQLGRFQGMTASSDFSEMAIVVNNVMYFTSGEYANSTLTFQGRNQANNETREQVVSGGTGAFRYAHGYSTQTTSFRGEKFDIVRFVVSVVFTDI